MAETTEETAVDNPGDSLVEITHKDLIEDMTQDSVNNKQVIEKEADLIGDEKTQEEGKDQGEMKIDFTEENTLKGRNNSYSVELIRIPHSEYLKCVCNLLFIDNHSNQISLVFVSLFVSSNCFKDNQTTKLTLLDHHIITVVDSP